MTDYLEYIAGLIGALAGYFFGGFDGLIKALIAFAVVDYFTGMAAAWYSNELSSQIGFKGILRKVTMFVLVGVAHIVDRELVSKVLGNAAILREGVLYSFLVNETLSIIENANKMDIPMPEVLTKHLLQIKNKHTEPLK
ncbi:MAG: phage holin family protein [Synergistaceae bacterium]|nr:phage holin family protein [Synergistaceae bacterium]